MTATAVKRKLRLKERSQKRKAKKGGGKGDDDRVSACCVCQVVWCCACVTLSELFVDGVLPACSF